MSEFKLRPYGRSQWQLTIRGWTVTYTSLKAIRKHVYHNARKLDISGKKLQRALDAAERLSRSA